MSDPTPLTPFKCDACGMWFDHGAPPLLCATCEAERDLLAIRAFVERVEKRVASVTRDADAIYTIPGRASYSLAIKAELAAIEGEPQ